MVAGDITTQPKQGKQALQMSYFYGPKQEQEKQLKLLGLWPIAAAFPNVIFEGEIVSTLELRNKIH